MQKSIRLALAIAVAAGLSACTTSDLERAGAGAAIGGATALILDGNIATGVIVGAAGGALCDDVNIC